MPEQAAPESKRLEIRKYPNRRYYDATRSRHLTLDEIRSLIRDGYDLRVTDSKSGLDITAQVMTQIILELETQKLDSFPVPLLVRLIRVNDSLVKDFIEKYFNQALHSFLDYQHKVEERLREVHGLPSVYPSVSAWTKAMLQPLAAAFGGAEPNVPTATPPAADQTAELRQAIKDLQEELETLKKAHPKRATRQQNKRRRSPK